MSRLTLNLLLAITWSLLHAEISFGRLVTGFLLGFVAQVFVERARGERRYAKAAAFVLALAWGFARELFLSSLTLARDILRPRPVFHPAFVRLPVGDLGDLEMSLLANLISLTPGTITVDADPVDRALYVHSLYARDPAEVVAKLRGFADLIRRAGGRG